MNMRIVTDSTCDLPEKTVKGHQISVIPLHIHQGENTIRDGVDMSWENFHTQLPGYKPSPKTAAPSPETFRQKYEQLADEGAHLGIGALGFACVSIKESAS